MTPAGVSLLQGERFNLIDCGLGTPQRIDDLGADNETPRTAYASDRWVALGLKAVKTLDTSPVTFLARNCRAIPELSGVRVQMRWNLIIFINFRHLPTKKEAVTQYNKLSATASDNVVRSENDVEHKSLTTTFALWYTGASRTSVLFES